MSESAFIPTPTERGALGRWLVLADISPKTRDVRRVKARARALAKDLGETEDSPLSSMENMLVLRVSVLASMIEHAEASMLSGVPVAIAEYTQLVTLMRRLLVTLSPSLKRVAKDVTPTLNEYLDQITPKQIDQINYDKTNENEEAAE